MRLKEWLQYVPIKWRNNLNYINFANYANISERDAERFFYEIYEDKYLFLKFQISCPICKEECWVNENNEKIFTCSNCENKFEWKEYLDQANYTYVANMELLAIEKKRGRSMSPIELFKEKTKNNEDNIIELKEMDNKSNDINIFISYAHEDEEYKDKLIKHLIGLKRKNIIKEWHDRKILAGENLDDEINTNLLNSDIILLIISVDFLNLDYCYEKEMNKALEMNKNKIARVIPIIVRSCDWMGSPFGKLNALPTDAKYVKSWNDEDEAYMNIISGIKEVIEDIKRNR